MKPNRWPYRQKKGANKELSAQNIEKIAKLLSSAIHGASSIEVNSDGIKISANSILLDHSTKSERR